MLKIELIGNLGSDCEVKDANGSKFAVMRVAHTESWKNEKGEKQERTIWVDVIYNDVESKLLDFLKSGQKVFVRGSVSLRVYSSPKDRCMKAGMTVNAREIELLGGQTDAVPKKLVDPESGLLYDVQKFYGINKDTSKFKESEFAVMQDIKGNRYKLVKGGFVAPLVEEEKPQD